MQPTNKINENLSQEELKTLLRSREFQQRVKEISAEVIEELYKTLWQKKSFWSSSVKK